MDPLRVKGTQVEGRHDLGVPELRCRARRLNDNVTGSAFRPRSVYDSRHSSASVAGGGGGPPDQRADRDLRFEPGQGGAEQQK